MIIDFNSRTADGRDPSWLWDVPFERLRGRQVLVTGERREDVGVRLAYADVPHSSIRPPKPPPPMRPEGLVDVVANYTAFRDLLVRTNGVGGAMTTESATRIALVYPELLGTYGDGGNAQILATRLRWRGLAAEIVSVPAGRAASRAVRSVPARRWRGRAAGARGRRAARGRRGWSVRSSRAPWLWRCAPDIRSPARVPGVRRPRSTTGVGLLPVETRRSFAGPGEPVPPRAVGDIVVDADPALELPPLLGYENHGGRTRPVEGAKGKPLGVVRRGIGNGTPDRAEGWVTDRVIATYLHGPVLAQNPALADLLLRWVHPDLPPLDAPAEADVLRAARMRALGV